MRHPGRKLWLFGAFFAVFLAALVLALAAGDFSPKALLRGLFSSEPDADLSLVRTIFFSLRLPRALTAAVCGSALAVAGVVSQGLFRNALASPSVLGTEAGGGLAAVILFYSGAAYAHWLTLPIAAFFGALAVTWVIFRLSQTIQSQNLATLLLTGFAINALAAAATSFVISLSLEDVQKAGAAMHWLLGGFAAKGWEHLAIAGVPISLGLLLAWRLAPLLDILQLGDDVAETLSIDLTKLRLNTIIAMALLIAGAVAVAGALPFIGLIVPHATRLLLGPKHRPLVGAAAVNGMSLVLVADVVARTLRAPVEIEVGILTSLLGAPFFLWLLFARRGQTQF